MSKPTVGFIGLGKMGAPMVSRIAQAGYPLALYDTNSAQLNDVANGCNGQIVSNPGTLLETCSFIITMLPDSAAVRTVLIDSGLAKLTTPGTIIDMGSSDLIKTRALGIELSKSGFNFMDAPVSGGVPRAHTGELSIIMGGDEETVSACKPLLSTMGSNLFHAGPLGAGHAMKALNNYVSAAGLVAAVEALRLGEAFGLDPERIVETLNASTGKNNTTENKLAQHIIPKTYKSGFSLGLMCKDLETALGLSTETGVPAPFAENCVNYWKEALEMLGPAADHTAVVDKPD